jgi:hypothetical protein
MPPLSSSGEKHNTSTLEKDFFDTQAIEQLNTLLYSDSLSNNPVIRVTQNERDSKGGQIFIKPFDDHIKQVNARLLKKHETKPPLDFNIGKFAFEESVQMASRRI